MAGTTDDSINAKLLIQLPGREPVEIGAINIPLIYTRGDVAHPNATVDHDALGAEVDDHIATTVMGRP